MILVLLSVLAKLLAGTVLKLVTVKPWRMLAFKLGFAAAGTMSDQ